MLKGLFGFLLLISMMNAGEISASKYAKLVQKGKKIAQNLCEASKLSALESQTFPDLLNEIKTQKPCLSLNTKNLEALAYFILAGSKQAHTHKKQMHVPKDAKCPVCGMYVSKYPKWASSIHINKEMKYFDGIKDMMKFYIFDVDFPYDRKHIKAIKVSDFYTLESIDAKEAFYVIGSNVYGPMGNELIAFSTHKASKNFKADHQGKSILRFNEITSTLVMGLDGIDY